MNTNNLLLKNIYYFFIIKSSMIKTHLKTTNLCSSQNFTPQKSIYLLLNIFLIFKLGILLPPDMSYHHHINFNSFKLSNCSLVQCECVLSMCLSGMNVAPALEVFYGQPKRRTPSSLQAGSGAVVYLFETINK